MFLLLLLPLVFCFTSVLADSAWNGHTTPGSTDPSKFTPLYVPSGTTAYDASPPLLHYSGAWLVLESPDYYNSTLYRTNSKQASALFNFTGTGIEMYGSTGSRYGSAQVYIDGKIQQTINAHSSASRQQQLLFFSYKLSPGPHSIEIVNKGSNSGSRLDIDAYVVTDNSDRQPPTSDPLSPVLDLSSHVQVDAVSQPAAWSLVQKGSTGVAAMQIAVISTTHAIIIDKVEHNPLSINGHPAWGTLYNLNTHALKPLNIKSNSFCAGGTFLSNGTLINVGGNPVVSDHTSAADFGDVDGLQAIRIFHPCEGNDVSNCDMYENHARIRMASPRWYNTVLRISDGSAMIIGGSKKGGWINNATTNNPTVEYYPPKNIGGSNGLPIRLQFFVDTLNSNLFPIAFSLPGNKVFIAANRNAMIYDWQTNTEQRLPQIPNGSNSFCAGGTFLSNGTLINVGGNPVVSDHTSAADFGDVDGLQAIRIFHPCEGNDVSNCDMYENHARIRMASPRWYNTVLRISDGSAMIIGGSKKGGWINNATTNNPTVEYYPPKNIGGSNGLPIRLQFFVDTLNSNLFPIAFSLPGNKVFIAANRNAMIYDWQTNTEQRLPQIPNGVRVTYPMTGTGLLLPLSPDNNYTPEILLCGGSTLDDTVPGYTLSSQDPASSQCVRMVLTNAGIAAGWQVEQMPQARMMPDAVLLPTGEVLIVNGGATGISGYANVKDQVGVSNADNPIYTPVLYSPSAAPGQRFSQAGMPTSDIPRLYHSVATLTPKGDVMIAGSNPNLDRSETRYGTEYRVEWLAPPYVSQPRPAVASVPSRLPFGQTITMELKVPVGTDALPPTDVKVALMDLGYVTHAVHANSRLVYLQSTYNMGKETLSVTGPPDGDVYPPGPGWLYVVVDGVPSEGQLIMVGDGKSPPVDEAAMKNMLAQTQVDQYEKSKGGDDAGE
ncbi:galactose oxidase [Rickenella mellea]|uniref:Galactose oxidase n=1 Tax=Rickenella mellea TaxID=50990 RepID=A0A4Y7QIH4_9AGAM|nr:galactose oxidase [Rickenella mellea]